MRPNLVVARVGDRSLHPAWIDPARPRNWDLLLLPYQPIPDQAGLDATVHDVVPGPKWSGIRQLLGEWDGWRDYEFVWMPDDDIEVDQAVVNRMFDIAAAVGLDLFAPALDEQSHYAHYSTMRNPRVTGRWVGFVEIMVPALRTSALATLLPTLDLTENGWGWGLDSVWPKLLGYERVGIIDATPVRHTRPVGQMRDVELHASVMAESDRLLEQFGCAQVHTTFGAFGEHLQPLDLSPERLLAELVEGWRYLWARDPRVLSWIVEFHGQRFPAPEYPVEGTPGAQGQPAP